MQLGTGHRLDTTSPCDPAPKSLQAGHRHLGPESYTGTVPDAVCTDLVTPPVRGVAGHAFALLVRHVEDEVRTRSVEPEDEGGHAARSMSGRPQAYPGGPKVAVRSRPIGTVP